MSFKEGVTASVHVTGTTLGNGEKNQGIRIDDETKHDNHTIANVEFMHTHIINEHNEGLDDLVDQEELGGDECDEKRKLALVVVQKDKQWNQLIRVSELSNFIGTIARNPRFISLMYTNWHAVPNDTKKCIWEYINFKFLIPVKGKKWVMTGLLDDAFKAVFGREQHGRRRCYDIPGCVGSNLASPVDASSAQAVRGTNLPHSSGLAHNSVLQKDKISRHIASLQKNEDLYFLIYCHALHY
ncbi:hypothetical protein H5410_051252 [Solanum commersonii]|uniref:Uncharacterized protein n=1 Tax=Solanum commersonii TaxID=4109 RepID=A0A9J5WXP2_SOLCO|nr:hypothetical protein H5410_051252 [Solanum commersonii]